MKKGLWDDSLSVGIATIDEQHKTLLKHLGELSEAVSLNRGTTEIVGALGFLIDYTRLHFATEEKHMTENNYSGYEQHKVLHEGFKSTLKNLGEDFEEEGATPSLAEAINTLFINLFIKHIQIVDQEMGAFFIEKGVTVTAAE